MACRAARPGVRGEKTVSNSLSSGAGAAIKAINDAGGSVDMALARARRPGSGYGDMVALMQTFGAAAAALQHLALAGAIEQKDGAQHGQAKAVQEKFDQNCAQANSAAGQDLIQVRDWQSEQHQLVSGTGIYAVRRFADFALRRDGQLNFKGLGLAYLGGALALLAGGLSGERIMVLALCFPLLAWALALFAEEQLQRARRRIDAQADDNRTLITRQRDATLARHAAERDAQLRRIADDLATRLARISTITSQADALIAARAAEATLVLKGWNQKRQTANAALEQQGGGDIPPQTLELGQLNCLRP